MSLARKILYVHVFLHNLESFLWVDSVLSRFSNVQLFATLWAVARHAPVSIGFSQGSKNTEWVASDLLLGIDSKKIHYCIKGHDPSHGMNCVFFKIPMLSLDPNTMVFGGGAFGSQLG